MAVHAGITIFSPALCLNCLNYQLSLLVTLDNDLKEWRGTHSSILRWLFCKCIQLQSKRAISFSSNFASAERCLIYENDWNLKFLKKLCINSGAFFPMQAFFQMLKISVPHKWWRAKFSLVPENIGKWNKNSLCDFFVTLCSYVKK